MRQIRWAGLAIFVTAAPLAGQSAPDVGVELTGRLQSQFHTSTVDGAASTFDLRRVRIGAEVTIGDAMRGMIEPEYALGQLKLRQAWLEYDVADWMSVRAGQFKKPFSLIQLTSSLTIPTIERGLRIRGIASSYAAEDEAGGAPVLSDAGGPLLGEHQWLLDGLGYQNYDVGAGVHGEIGALSYDVGVFNGGGADALDADDGKAFAARVEVAAADALTLGGAISRSNLAGDDLDADGVAFEIDAEWGGFRRAGPHLLAEVAFGDNMAADDEFVAGQAILAWFAPVTGGRVEGVEPVLRGGWGDPAADRDDDAGILVTPGFNVYFHGRNRLMVNWDVFVPQGDRFSTEQSFKVQAQLHF